MTSASRKSLAKAITAQEAKLALLDRAREDVRLELERLRGEMIALDVEATKQIALTSLCGSAPSMTSSEKVALFRSLFRGREDVYPKLWENNRTGKNGYAPACVSSATARTVVNQLAMFLGIDNKAIGRIGGGKRKPNGLLDVAMLQSLVRGDAVNDIVASYGHVIVDECHHVPAVSFERVLATSERGT